MRILYQNTRQSRINLWDHHHWKRISETNLKSQWKWTEMVKLKEDKQVGQNFIELKHMAVVILLNYLKTKEMLKNCEAKWLGCVLTLPIYRGWEQHGKGREAGDKGAGSGRAGYGRRKVLTPLSPPHLSIIFKRNFVGNMKIVKGGWRRQCHRSCSHLLSVRS